MLNTMIGLGTTLIVPKLMKGVQDQKVNVVHASPGRVRLQCDKWKNAPTADNLITHFEKLSIVSRAEASPITGSLLLEFRTQTLTEAQFDGLVKTAVKVSVSTYAELDANLNLVLRHIVKTIDTTMKRQSAGNIDLDALLSTGLIVGGVVGMSVNPIFASSLFYWGYSLITNKR